MNKRNFLTVAGITLSFAIAIGGWFLISYLIEIKSDKLLSVTLNVATNALNNIPLDMTSTISDSTGDDFPIAQSNLSENEIVSILKNWNSSGRETPHEPTAEQLNMEQAIEAGNEWLSVISRLNIFPDELLHFTNMRAYLFQNLPSEQGGRFLPPAYSYWTVVFTNDSISVNMVINAVSGQVWKTDVNIFKMDIDINEEDITNALIAFTSMFEMTFDESGEFTRLPIQNGSDNEFVRVPENGHMFMIMKGEPESLTAFYSFADGKANAEVIATG